MVLACLSLGIARVEFAQGPSLLWRTPFVIICRVRQGGSEDLGVNSLGGTTVEGPGADGAVGVEGSVQMGLGVRVSVQSRIGGARGGLKDSTSKLNNRQ